MVCSELRYLSGMSCFLRGMVVDVESSDRGSGLYFGDVHPRESKGRGSSMKWVVWRFVEL